MGLMDQLTGAAKGILGQVDATSAPSLISATLAKTNLGGLQGLVAKLQQGGLKDQVASWLGKGENAPVTSDQIKTALEPEQIKALSEKFGASEDDVLKLLAEHLPSAVDKASPDGALSTTA